MSTFTRDTTELAIDLEGVGQQYRAEAGGMLIALERWSAGLDTAEMFAGLPGGACHEHHFGYVVKGVCTVRYTDGHQETLSAGQAYHLEPGHNVHIDQDAEFVEFTPADQTPGVNTLEFSSHTAG